MYLISYRIISVVSCASQVRELDENVFDTAVQENHHVHMLVKTLALCFCKVRFHHTARH